MTICRMCRWLDMRTLEIDHLTPGRPYLLRYGYSQLKTVGGDAYEELSGMILLQPSAERMEVTWTRGSGAGLLSAVGIMLLALAACITLAAYRPQEPQ